MIEVEQAPVREQEAAPPSHYVYIAGLFGSEAGQELTSKYFEEQLVGEEDSFSVYNSIISADKHDPNRLEKIANDFYKRIIDDKENLKCVVHSLGATELSKIIRLLRKRSEITSDVLRDKLEIILVSPFGFASNRSEKFTMLKRVAEKTLPIHFGVASMTLTPPENMTSREISQYIHHAIPDFLDDERIKSLQHFSTEGESFFDRFPDKEKEVVREIAAAHDIRLKEFAEAEDWESFRKTLSERGKALQPYVSKALEGREAATTPLSEYKYELPVGNLISFLKSKEGRSLLKSSLDGEVYRTFLYLRAEGVKIKFLVPQFDVLLPFDEVEKIFQDNGEEPWFDSDEETEEIGVLGNSGHESFALRSKGLVTVIKQLFEGELG